MQLRQRYVSVTILFGASLLCAIGCGDSDNPGGTGGTGGQIGATGGDGGSVGECSVGETDCVDGDQITCIEQNGTLAWSTPSPCDVNAICKTTGCEAATTVQAAQAEALTTYAQDLIDHTGHLQPLSMDTLVANATRQLLLGDGSDYAFAKAVYSIFRAVPHGHTSVAFGDLSWSDCFEPTGVAPLANGSWYGVCAREADDSAIITFVDGQANSLGLSLGDKVISVTKNGETWAQPELLDRVSLEPTCDTTRPSSSAAKDYNATTLFGILTEGDTIDVERVDGTIETITVGPRSDAQIGCRDPFRRPERMDLFASSQRPDGVVVVILPTLGDHPDHPFPSPLTLQSYRDWNAEAIDLLNAEIQQYNNVTGLIWDVRGNTGGAQEYGMAVVGSLGDTAGGLGNCYARIVGSDPPEVSAEPEYPFPYQIFVDQPLPTIGFQGPQAIVSDGAAASAADWMLHRASEVGIPIVGHSAHGAYGYGTGSSFVEKSQPGTDEHIGVSSFISGAHCLDANGQPLEGTAPVDVVVDLSSSDLAAGIDTQLEAAVDIVLNNP